MKKKIKEYARRLLGKHEPAKAKHKKPAPTWHHVVVRAERGIPRIFVDGVERRQFKTMRKFKGVTQAEIAESQRVCVFRVHGAQVMIPVDLEHEKQELWLKMGE